MANADSKKQKKEKTSVDSVEKKDITLKETEDDIIFGKGFKSDAEDFKSEVVKEAQKTGILGFLLPFFVFILIAGLSGLATYYYAKPERSIEATSQKPEDKIQNLPEVPNQQVKETPAPTTPKVTPPTETKDTAYTVQEGDTMSGIANKYNMTSAELAKYNGLSDVHSLKIGQTLKIPAK